MIEAYLRKLKVERRLTRRTLKLYESELRMLERLQSDRDALLKHLSFCVPETVQRKLIIWKAYLRTHGDNSLDTIAIPKIRRKKVEYLTDAEAEKFLGYSGRLPMEDQIFIEIALKMGLRLSEILQLTSANVKGSSLSFMRKGNHTQILPIPLDLQGKLQGFQGFTKTDRYFQKMVRRIANECGINRRITPHTLRHTFATRIASQGKNLFALKEFLGHQSIATTERYVHVTSEHLRDLVS